jgi:hypothetical protein
VASPSFPQEVGILAQLTSLTVRGTSCATLPLDHVLLSACPKALSSFDHPQSTTMSSSFQDMLEGRIVCVDPFLVSTSC